MEYKKKQRPQKIRMLDGSVKTVMVDDSKTVGELLVTICSRIGEHSRAKVPVFILFITHLFFFLPPFGDLPIPNVS